jgi:hypothetical protein
MAWLIFDTLFDMAMEEGRLLDPPLTSGGTGTACRRSARPGSSEAGGS